MNLEEAGCEVMELNQLAPNRVHLNTAKLCIRDEPGW
jgi:hypothetical protein